MKSLMPNDFGNNQLIEESRQIRMTDVLRSYRRQVKELILTTAVELQGLKVDLITTKTHNGGIRYWFKCPWCGRRVGTLYQHTSGATIGCRSCLGLKYRKQRFKGMVENQI